MFPHYHHTFIASKTFILYLCANLEYEILDILPHFIELFHFFMRKLSSILCLKTKVLAGTIKELKDNTEGAD